MNEQDEIQLILSDRFAITNSEDWFNQFVERIDYLLQTDFPKLVNILYGLDVSETKLAVMLKESPGRDTAEIIARLIIERQTEKIRTRALNTKRDDDIADSEKW